MSPVPMVTEPGELIAEETEAADDIEPWVAASALMGAHRTLLDRTRRGVLAGCRGAEALAPQRLR